MTSGGSTRVGSDPGGSTLGVGRDQEDLRDAVRTLVTRRVTEDVIRAAIDAKAEALPAFWSELATQGLLGLHLPESAGGAGHGLLEVAVVVEELGRALVPGPYLPTVLAGAVLAAAGHEEFLPAFADGTATGALALHGRLRAVAPAAGTGGPGGLVVDGEVTEVLGGVTAGVFVVPIDVAGDRRWVVLPHSDVEVDEQPSHDPTRRLASVRATGVSVPPERVLELPADRPIELAAVLAAAEASGIADACTAEAAGYARVREQFGRPIGQFQGVKHRTARMLVRAEQARACAWDAARAADELAAGLVAPEEAAMAAAVAGAAALPAGFENAKDCINTLGGIGFTWEHLAGFRLRRAQTLLLLAGPASRWQERVAELAVDGVRRELRLDLPPEAEAVRAGIRVELAEATALEAPASRRHLADRGYTAPHLPEPWGKGADAVTQLVIAEELAVADLVPHNMVIGNWVVPTLIAHGSSELQQRLVPPSLRGDITWCQLFSEPGAGSDLAGLSTRAEKVDGGWRITGQKVWTSQARQADHGILLARTDDTVAKHRGLSYFIVDMTLPGIEIRPLRELTGEAMFNEVFLDGVVVPDEMLVGEPGEGWRLARTTLANERVAMTAGSTLGDGGELLVELLAAGADGRAAGAETAARRTRLGSILTDAQAGGLLGLRQTLRSLAGQSPGAETSITKLLGVEHIQDVWETAMEWQGPAALCADPGSWTATWRFLSSRSLSIAGGTTDVQLNIIGERLLDLPRDPEPGR